MSDYMKQVAEILDVEIGKTYDLYAKNELIACKFTEHGVKYYEDAENEWLYDDRLLGEIINGRWKIIRRWKPSYLDDEYFIPSIESGVPSACKRIWYDSETGNRHYEVGMLCRTREEAKDKARYMLNALREYCND